VIGDCVIIGLCEGGSGVVSMWPRALSVLVVKAGWQECSRPGAKSASEWYRRHGRVLCPGSRCGKKFNLAC